MEFSSYLRKIVDGDNLSESEAENIALKIMAGEVPDTLVAAILVALRMKGEAVSEVVGFAKAMRAMAVGIEAEDAIDTAGTGGDGYSTFNVSTASALLVSIVHPVAKHGNRAVSGRSGSADVLETLGYNINVPPDKAIELLKRTNFVFLFAPLYHTAMKRVASIRRALGIRTIFNILGPLTNPARTKRQIIGVFSRSYMRIVAEATARLSYRRAFIVHGEPGIDEVSPSGTTYVYEVRGSKIDYFTVVPEDFGAKRVSLERLTVSTPEESAVRLLRAAKGRDRDVAEFIKMNSALALYVAEKCRDVKDCYEYSSQLMEGLLKKIEEIIESNGDVARFRRLEEAV